MKNRLFYILKSQKGLSSLRDKVVHDVGLSGFSSMAARKNACDRSVTESVKKAVTGSSPVGNLAFGANTLRKDIQKVNAESVFLRERQVREGRSTLLSPHQFGKHYGGYPMHPCLTRPMSSSSVPQRTGQTQQQHKKEVSAFEDTFEAPTSNIPEKPVTFVEATSYTAVILLGLGFALAVAYTACKELLFTPNEYKVYGKALERIQNERKVKDVIGTPIKGYGQETRSRSARRHIPHKLWTDEEGVERCLVSFVLRGPRGTGNVNCEMFKDNSDGEWKYTVLLVQLHPSGSNRPVQMILESYIPAYK